MRDVPFQQHFRFLQSAIDLIEGKGRNVEGITKFAANVISAGGALLDAAERAIYKFKSFSLKPLVRLAIGESGLVKLATFLERTAKFCAWFGWVAVGWDAYHFYDETRNKHNYGLGAACDSWASRYRNSYAFRFWFSCLYSNAEPRRYPEMACCLLVANDSGRGR